MFRRTLWHKQLWLIDHGASLYFQHSWENWEEQSLKPFSQIRDHVLLPWATDLERAARDLKEQLSVRVFREIVAAIPDSWLETDGSSVDDRRRIYVEYLKRRFENSDDLLEEAERAREKLV